MKEQSKVWVPIVCLIITLGSVLWATSEDRTAAWAAIRTNTKQITELKKSQEDIAQIREDVAVIKKVIEMYERQTARSYK